MQRKVRKSKLNLDRMLILYSLGYNDKRIAEHLKASISTITYARQKILKLKPVLETLRLTKNQEEILIGTLLGDSYIGYVYEGCKYPCLTFGHCKKQEIYAYSKFNKLKPIMSSIREKQYVTTTIIKGKVCNIQPVLYARSHNCKCLVEFRKAFYPKGIKIIPIEFIKDKFTAQSLAYLFMDDGCKNQKSYNLNLQCFTKENLYQFANFLREKFNLEFTVKNDKTLYLRYKSIKTFEELVYPYLTSDMMYKLNSSHLKTS